MTRDRLIVAAERLFAEQGLSVSNRQIGEAAGQGNNSVVSYHFGTKTDLVLAIARSHSADIDARRIDLIERRKRPADLGTWFEVVVRPITDHIEALGTPSWYARFLAQATSSPAMAPLLYEETLAAPSMHEPFLGVSKILGDIPKEVFAERADMTRHIIVNTCAERERALHLGLPTPRATWSGAANGMIDALVGLWEARATKEKRK